MVAINREKEQADRSIRSIFLTKVAMMIAATIRDSRDGMPSGHLYCAVMDVINLDEYNILIGTLKQNGLISESGHYLTWIGPKKEGE